MAEDHLLDPSLLANTIFLRRSDYQAYLSGLFKIGKTKPLFRKGKKSKIVDEKDMLKTLMDEIHKVERELADPN